MPWIRTDAVPDARRWWYGGGEAIPETLQFWYDPTTGELLPVTLKGYRQGALIRGCEIKGWVDNGVIRPMRAG
jgi:hypothetical protein